MSYDPLRAPIERARRMEDCDEARRELDAFAHQPKPEPPPRGWLWDQGLGVIGVAVALIILIALL